MKHCAVLIQVLGISLVAVAGCSTNTGPGQAKLESKVLDLGNGVKMEMVLIPAGSFMMGDAAGEACERPVHKVTITKPFYIGKYLVTQEQWESVMGNNPSEFKGPKNPVENVNYKDCQAFLKKLEEKFGPTAPSSRCPPRHSGSTLAALEQQRDTTSAIPKKTWINTRGLPATLIAGPTRSARRNRMPGGYTTCMEVFRSGAQTVMAKIIIRHPRQTTRRVRPTRHPRQTTRRARRAGPECIAAAVTSTRLPTAAPPAAASRAHTYRVVFSVFAWFAQVVPRFTESAKVRAPVDA